MPDKDSSESWERLRGALSKPRVASWKRIAFLLDAWPDRDELLTKVIPHCQEQLDKWPAVQRSPLSWWMQPELVGEPPHPLMQLTRGPGCYVLQFGITSGPLGESQSFVYYDLADVPGDVRGAYRRLFNKMFPCYGQDPRIEERLETIGLKRYATLYVVQLGRIVEEIDYTPVFEAERGEALARALAAVPRPKRSPRGEMWSAFFHSFAYHTSRRPQDDLSYRCHEQDHVGFSNIPPALRDAPRLVLVNDKTILCSAGDAGTWVITSRGRRTFACAFEGWRALPRRMRGYVLWRSDDLVEVLTVPEMRLMSRWRRADGGALPEPEWVRDVPAAMVSFSEKLNGSPRGAPRYRRRFQASFGSEFRATLGPDAMIVSPRAPAPRSRPRPQLSPGRPRDVMIEELLGELTELSLWSPRHPGDVALIARELASAELTRAFELASLLARACMMLGARAQPELARCIVGLLCLNDDNRAGYDRVFDGLLERGDIRIERGDTPRHMLLLLLVWAGTFYRTPHQVGRELGEVLLELPWVEDLCCDNDTLGRFVWAGRRG